MAMEKGALDKADAYINEMTTIFGENVLSFARFSPSIKSRLAHLRGDDTKYKQELVKGIRLLKATPTQWIYKYFLVEILDPLFIFEPSKTASILGSIYTSEKDPFAVVVDPIHWRFYERAEARSLGTKKYALLAQGYTAVLYSFYNSSHEGLFPINISIR